MSVLPVIAIVGRPNVGKSSLLNALAGKRISIVQDLPGVTRDRISTPLRIGDRYVELVDTGGYGFVDPDALTEHIRHQIEIAVSEARLVLFVVDCREGLTGADIEIGTMLRTKGVKTVLVANKADGTNADMMLTDFARLGLGTPLGVAALGGRNIDVLRDTLASNIDLSDAPTEVPPPQMMVAIVGKRNAGKSTLVNSIAEHYEGHGDRVIVSEVPGTTRDSVDVRFEKDGKALIVIDTAGVRKKRQMVMNDIAFYSFHRAERSIRRADVVLMLIDATEPVSEPDKKLANYIASQFKPVILVINKWDLAREQAAAANAEKRGESKSGRIDDAELMAKFREYLDEELKHVDYAPLAFITAKEGRNVQGVLDLAQHLFAEANTRVTTHRLNNSIRKLLQEHRPSTPSGRKARIYYATQSDVAPPTIVLFVNNPNYLDDSYQRFMINRFRELLPYAQVPIRLVVRARERNDRSQPLDLTDPDAETAKPRSAPKQRASGPKSGLRIAKARKAEIQRAAKARKTEIRNAKSETYPNGRRKI